MKLIYHGTQELYSTIRSILKKEQGEKIAPYIFKINDTQTLEAYLRKEKITCNDMNTRYGLSIFSWVTQII